MKRLRPKRSTELNFISRCDEKRSITRRMWKSFRVGFENSFTHTNFSWISIIKPIKSKVTAEPCFRKATCRRTIGPFESDFRTYIKIIQQY